MSVAAREARGFHVPFHGTKMTSSSLIVDARVGSGNPTLLTPARRDHDEDAAPTTSDQVVPRLLP